MREVSISQLWGRAWYLFKVNWLLFVGFYVLLVIVIFISIIALFLGLVFLRFLILSFIDLRFFILGFIGLSSFIVSFIGLLIVPLILTPAFVRAGYLVARQGQSSFGEVFRDLNSLLKIFVYELTLLLILWILLRIAPPGWDVLDILVVAGFTVLFLSFFVWAAPYCVLSGRAGIFSAIGQSFSLTWRNFSKVFVALLSVIGLLILGLLPLGLGLLMEVPILILGWVLLCGLGLLVVGSMVSIFLPLLYFALTDEEGVSHA
jgi:hypothetical protein